MRRINYYAYDSYNGVFSPLLDNTKNKIFSIFEGQMKFANLDGFGRLIEVVRIQCRIGYFI